MVAAADDYTQASMADYQDVSPMLQVQFVHVYTGGTEKATAIAISMYYSLHCLAVRCCCLWRTLLPRAALALASACCGRLH